MIPTEKKNKLYRLKNLPTEENQCFQLNKYARKYEIYLTII